MIFVSQDYGNQNSNTESKALHYSSWSSVKKELQRVLNKLLNLGLAVDGKLGPKTIAVIKTWQKANGLVADVLVGKLTKAAINVEAAK